MSKKFLALTASGTIEQFQLPTFPTYYYAALQSCLHELPRPSIV